MFRTKTFKINSRPALWFAVLLCAIFLVYFPGMTGGFIFDDVGNILENENLALKKLNFENIWAVSLSGNSGPLMRPVSVLSFALNYYISSGLSPWWMKMTNLCIHLVNTLLVGLFAHGLLSALWRKNKIEGIAPAASYAWLVAAIWGLHPLNLTGVLYIVQRMTSLTTLFGLSALCLYLKWRSIEAVSSWRQWVVRGLLITLLFILSILSKENGILFIPLLLLVELFIFSGTRNDQPLKIGRVHLQWITGFVLISGVILFLTYALLITKPEHFWHRNFNMTERLMTESRVLFYYLRLFLFPSLSEMMLFHDDFEISRGLFIPWTTSLSIAGLVIITFFAVWFRKCFPLFLFAWGWFIISHLMESTVISLELVFEHRNYFSFLGFLAWGAWELARSAVKIRKIVFLLLGVYITLCAFITWQRSEIWGNTVTHVVFEANMHPRSYAANFQAAQELYVVMKRDGKLDLTSLIQSYLDQAKSAYYPGNSILVLQLRFDATLDRKSNLSVITALEKGLREKNFSHINNSDIETLVNDHIVGQTYLTHEKMLLLFKAALENKKISAFQKAQVYCSMSRYYGLVLLDRAEAEKMMRLSLRYSDDVHGRLMLAQILRIQGKWQEASETLDWVKAHNWNKRMQQEILQEATLIMEKNTGVDKRDILPNHQDKEISGRNAQ
ncbi:MAG: hypothetical protein LBG69_07940 [Zoogloeaceae bacterium]|jgi:hypothetical protein|nr:hypothetical protein [Zoogloeaceae bacterium]